MPREPRRSYYNNQPSSHCGERELHSSFRNIQGLDEPLCRPLHD